jgi:hypothetical protein
MSFFQGLGQALDPNRIAMTQALLAGDYAAVGQLTARQQQLRAQQAEARREQEARDNQIWGAKELGYSVPEVSALSPGDLSHVQRERMLPYTLSPGAQRGTPGIGGQPAQTTTAPTTDQQMVEYLQRTDPSGRLATSYLAKQAALTATGVDEQGRPTVTQIDPAGLFPGLNLNLGGQQPQTGAPPPQVPAADLQAPPGVAPAFGANVPLTEENRSAQYPVRPGARPAGPPQRPAALGNPVEEMARIVGVRPSSGYRTQGHQNSLVRQGLTRARSSQHTQGNALDFPIPAGPQQQAAAARIRQRYPQARFEFEATNLHVSLPGWGGAPDISGSRRRYPEGGGGLPMVRTPADAARLPPGTRFRTPDGQTRTRN